MMRVLQTPRQAWSSTGMGAFHTARMASPIYSISVPLLTEGGGVREIATV